MSTRKLSDRFLSAKRSGNSKFWRQTRSTNGRFGTIDTAKCAQANRIDLALVKHKLLKIKSTVVHDCF